MKSTAVKTRPPFKVLALILCVGALPLVCGVTGSRYKQSMGEYLDDHWVSSHVKKAVPNPLGRRHSILQVARSTEASHLAGAEHLALNSTNQ
jgi:hypothetical protein